MLLAVSYKLDMFLFTQCNCDDRSFVSHTQLYHTLSVEIIATPQLGVRRFESRHLRRWVEMKALGASLCPDQKAWGAAHSAATGPLSCYFLAVSLRGRGSKLVTVSFRLQSRAFSSCWGGMGSLLGRRKSPPTSPELPFSWFTDSRGKQGGWLKLSFSTHLFHYESSALILTRSLYPYLSAPSQMFHICFYKWFCERNQLSQRSQERLKLIGSKDFTSNKIKQ